MSHIFINTCRPLQSVKLVPITQLSIEHNISSFHQMLPDPSLDNIFPAITLWVKRISENSPKKWRQLTFHNVVTISVHLIARRTVAISVIIPWPSKRNGSKLPAGPIRPWNKFQCDNCHALIAHGGHNSPGRNYKQAKIIQCPLPCHRQTSKEWAFIPVFHADSLEASMTHGRWFTFHFHLEFPLSVL